jgi:hypothetical protein
MIVNKTGTLPITVRIYPIGAIFSGGGQYTVDARFPIDGNPIHKYIYPQQPFDIDYEHESSIYFVKANFDCSENRSDCDFSIGYGCYKIEFEDGIAEHYRECRVDFSDANFKGTSTNNYFQQLKINYYTWQTNGIKFQFFKEGVTTNEISIDDPNVQEYIQVWQQNGTGHSSLTPSKGNFNDTVTYHNYPIKATDFGALKHLESNFIKMNLKIKYQGANTIANSDYLFFTESEFRILDGITYNINSPNQFMVISGGGKFITGNSSIINIPEDFYFYINGFSTIDFNGTTFQPINPNSYWSNIGIEYPRNVNINNCTFKNAIDPVNIWYGRNNPCVIQNNCIFDNYVHNAISLTYTNNVVISDSYFSTEFSDPQVDNSVAISIAQSSNSENDNNDSPGTYWTYIIHNSFNNGISHIIASSLGDNLLPIYIDNNTFEEGLSNIYLWSNYGKILNNTGSIQNTYNNISFSPKNIELIQSSIDLFQNTFKGKYNNIVTYAGTEIDLEPGRTDNGQFFWKAGKNNLTAVNSTEHKFNILSDILSGRGEIYTDYGKNVFTNDGSGIAQIFAYLKNMNCLTDVYNTRCNDWTLYNNEPVLDIRDENSCNIQYNWQEPTGCDFDNQILDRLITDRGNGIFDTILVTSSNNVPPPTDDITLYSTGLKNQILKNYTTAILNFKGLINTYANSKYLTKSIYNIYGCYLSSDTNRNQGWRNIIFGDLKNYLENKIQQYQNNDEFVELSFDFLLKCKIKTKNYQQAMDGYQFIAENSPSATERLMASINYIDVEGLLQGSGGGQKYKFEDELSSDRNGIPIKDILLASYKSTKKSNEKKEKSDLQNSLDAAQTKELQQKTHKQEKVLENRALENISISSGLTKKERRERIQKDLMLLSQRSETAEKIIKKNNIEPLKYELSQNYPNPFNPITNIKYQIQKTGLVTLKIYDITGREIKTLVNEIKNPGSYIVSFNGTEFASGVYFYRIQAGDFVQVKKMILVK